MHNMLESNMDHIFNNRAISEEVRREFELYQPNNASERTFKNRPGNSENAAFTPIDRIPISHFFYYFNALSDRILPQINSMSSRLILFTLFRKSHGFNRNWCQMSLPELKRKVGASRNTIRAGLKSLIEEGWVCIIADGYHEATTYGLRLPVDIKEKLAEKREEPPPEPAQPSDSNTTISPEIGDQNLTLGGSKSDRQKLTPYTGSTCTKQFIGKTPDSHFQKYTRVRTDSIPEPKGENRVTDLHQVSTCIDNQNGRNSHASLPSTKTDQEESYLKSLPKKKVGEIYRAQDAWDEILGPDTRPSASKLNEMLQCMRGWYRGETLDTKFRWCLADTKKKRPRDAVAWLISALKHGRYPNIVMKSQDKNKVGGNFSVQSSPRPKPSIPQSVNNPGKAPDAQPELDGDTSEQTCEATAEREKRRAASPHRELWEKVLKNIGEKILRQSYESWFEPLFIAEIGDTAIVFDAPDQLIADWLEENYIGLLTAEIEAVDLCGRSIAIKAHVRSS